MTNPKQEEIEKAWDIAWQKALESSLPKTVDTSQIKPIDYVENAFKRGCDAGYKAAKAESPWVPIAEIPEEWKDGRGLDLYHRQLGRMLGCGPTFLNALDNITHAMLPPPPPKESN